MISGIFKIEYNIRIDTFQLEAPFRKDDDFRIITNNIVNTLKLKINYSNYGFSNKTYL